MTGIRELVSRVNTLLVLTMIGLVLGLSLAWDRQQSRTTQSGPDRSAYAAELLAHGMTQEAAEILLQESNAAPGSSRGLKLRKILADLYTEKLGDYEKGLAQYVLLRTLDPGQASATEAGIRLCMDRLGRVYDVQRRQILEEGGNPLRIDVGASTAVRLGNESVLTFGDIEKKLGQLGISPKGAPRDAVEKIVQGMTSEVLLRRAARRSGIQREPRFLEQVRAFEENLALQKYLEEKILKDVKVDDQALSLFLEKNKAEFDSPLRVVYSVLAFSDETGARDFVSGKAVATPPMVLKDHENSLQEQLPAPLRSVKWDSDPVEGNLGPVESEGKWIVYPIHQVIPAKKTAPELARQQARLKLLEEKQGDKISSTLAELARQEEMKILKDEIFRYFCPNASDTQTGGNVGIH